MTSRRWRDLSDRELEQMYLAACAEHFQWRLDSTLVKDDYLHIRGWALSQSGKTEDARFLINGKPFEYVKFPEPSPDLGEIFWNVPAAKSARFFCSTSIDWQKSYPEGFARLEFDDGSDPTAVRRRAWYLPNPRLALAVPEEFRVRRVIGVPDRENYLIGGATIYKRLETYLRTTHSKTFDDFGTILDWACGCGRVARHFRWCSSRYYGVDIDGDNIDWCSQHLPHGQFRKTGVLPPLPFDDGTFDLVWAISILGQISKESQSLWLQELRRVTKKDGLLLVSAVGLTQIGLARPQPNMLREIEEKGFLVTGRNHDLDDVMPGQSHYFSGIHSRDHLRATLERYFSVLDITDAIVANDDLVVLRNDKPDAAIVHDIPVLPDQHTDHQNPFSLPLRDYDLNPFIHPTMARSGYRGHIVDMDGKDYVDFMSAWGTNLLGYGYPAVADAVKQQIDQFAGLGMPYPQFYELRDLIRRLVPSAEDVRYGKNGSDSCAGAVRLVRFLTGREKIVYRGYHGFHDWYFASTDCPGIPAALRETVISQTDLTPQAVAETFRQHPYQIAGLILNPLTPPVPSAEEMREIVDIVHRQGGMVIFDEMLSGFRVAPGGMQEIWGVQPDLSCFGKSIANGLPLSVLCGPERYIRRLPETYFGMTFEGEAVSIAAACATLKEVVNKNVVEALYEKGMRIREAYNQSSAAFGIRTALTGYEPCLAMEFQDQAGIPARQLLWLMNQELTRNGIFTLGAFILCYSHDDADLDRLEDSLKASLRVVRDAVDRQSTAGLLDQRVLQHMGDVTSPANWRRYS